MNRVPIQGSFFTTTDFKSQMKYLGTKTMDNVSQGYKPGSTPMGVLYRAENIPMAYYDIPTINQMVFSMSLWQNLRNSPVIKHLIDSGCFWGEGFHADREEVLIPEVAIRVTDFRPEANANKLVPGDIEILDTPNGRIVYTLASLGLIGNSSRGWGQLSPRKDKLLEVVEDDYFHVCWDTVTLPAVPEAMMKIAASARSNPQVKQLLESAVESDAVSYRFKQLKEMLADPKKQFNFVEGPAEQADQEMAVPTIYDHKDNFQNKLPEESLIESIEVGNYNKSRVQQARMSKKKKKIRK